MQGQKKQTICQTILTSGALLTSPHTPVNSILSSIPYVWALWPIWAETIFIESTNWESTNREHTTDMHCTVYTIKKYA